MKHWLEGTALAAIMALTCVEAEARPHHHGHVLAHAHGIIPGVTRHAGRHARSHAARHGKHSHANPVRHAHRLAPVSLPAPIPPSAADSDGAEARAAALVSRMTLEEKAHQLGHTAPAIPRLGVPEYNWWNEGLHGVARAGIATVFPQAIGMAASWDPALLKVVGNVVSTEFRAKYAERVHPDGGTEWYRGLTVWSPNINIFRDPRWGRGQETYGEDPSLTGTMGVAYIEGLQGDDPRYFRTIATSKHFAVHSGPESTRHQANVKPSAHDLEDTYLPAFRKTVTEARVQSVMCAYNAVDGVPGCANTMLMKAHLRDAWGFKGYVVSDCGAAANIFRPDALHYVKTAEDGVAVAFKAGMDLICGDYRNNMSTEPDPIVAAVRSGLLPQAVIDRSLTRLFTARYRLGLMEPAGSRPFADITPADNDTPAHHLAALKMAQESMVLLKNDGNLLPIQSEPETIAIIGPNADSMDALVGNYYGKPSHPVTVLDGIKARFPHAKIIYEMGTNLLGSAEVPVPEANFCVDRACVTSGLKVEVFANAEMRGTPVKTAIDRTARTNWVGEDRATATRWTGFFKAPETGEFAFRLASENGYRIFVDDKLVVDEWGVEDTPSTMSGKVRLEAGKTYGLRVEGVQSGAAGRQQIVWSPPAQTGDEAVAAAQSADLVVFVGGLSARIEGEEMKITAPGFSGGDRTSLNLPAPQESLLERVAATGKPVVLVLMNGSALSVNWAKAHIPAIVEAWYPGGDGGTAVAGLIAGDYSPAGRLPVTFYQSEDQLPPFEDYAMKGRTYRYFDGPVVFPFGHGLSYTRFTYAAPSLSAATIGAAQLASGGTLETSVQVTNAGGRDSDEVVELFLTKPGDTARLSLGGFERIHLKAGESRRVSFNLDARTLSQVDAEGARHLMPGLYRLSLGGGQPGQAATAEVKFTLTGTADLPK